LSRWRRLIQNTLIAWNDHNASTQSAALAFYTIFSLAPLLVVAVSLAGTVFGPAAVRGEILQQFQEWMGRDAASLVQAMLSTAAKPRVNRLAGIIGIATLLFGASGVFVQLQQSLNQIWEVAPRPGAALTSLLRKRVLSFALVLGIGFLLLVSLIISAALAALGDFLQARFRLPVGQLHLANLLVSFLIISLLFALIYRLLPDVRLGWRDVFLGALVTSALFSAGKTLIGIYLGRTGAASAYGAAGSLVMLTSWVYYSSLIFLLGAEFTHVHSCDRRGARPRPEPGAMPTAAAGPRATSSEAPRPPGGGGQRSAR
jgi:membrane protein